MASRDVTVKEWECDACGGTVLATNKSKDMLPGWVNVTFSIQGGLYSKTGEVCPQCAKDKAAATKRAQARLGGP